MALLDRENLDIYNRSIEFLTLALRLVGRLPRGERDCVFAGKSCVQRGCAQMAGACPDIS